MKRRDKALIFDYFGVLSSEVAPFWLERYFDRETAVELKARVVARADRGELTEEGMFRELSALSGEPAPAILEDWLALAVPERRFPPLLRELGERCTVALLSNAPGTYLRRLLERDGYLGCFDAMRISSEEGITKPDPEIYLRLLGDLGLRGEDCLFIDDNPANLRGGEAAGIPGVLYSGDFETLKEMLLRWAE